MVGQPLASLVSVLTCAAADEGPVENEVLGRGESAVETVAAETVAAEEVQTP